MRWLISVLATMLIATQSAAVECRDETFDGTSFTLCEVDATAEQITLFLNDQNDEPIGHFSSLDRSLGRQNQQLAFAMNAGMYHEDRSPVGHYVENGVEQRRVIKGASAGNFGLLPNGIFCVRKGRADVFETLAYVAKKPACIHASQSGPMLVINGKIHPRFLPDSTSRYIRNGVGTSADGTRAVFVISNRTVTFHTFARLFRDHLKTPNALFFDGNISRLYAPSLGRSDFGFSSLGPIVGVVKTKD